MILDEFHSIVLYNHIQELRQQYRFLCQNFLQNIVNRIFVFFMDVYEFFNS